MEKKISEEEFDKLLEEQFLKEADVIEEALFSDNSEEFDEKTDEEVDAAYESLIERLKARGEYREEEEKIVPMPHKETKAPSSKRFRLHNVARVAGLAAVCTIGVFAASMTSEANREYFVNTVRQMTGNDMRVVIDNAEDNDRGTEAEEYKAAEEIKSKLGIEIPDFQYRPKGFLFYGYDINEINKTAFVEYEYQNMVISLSGQKKNEIKVSTNFIFDGEGKTGIVLDTGQIPVEIFEVQAEGDSLAGYTAQWEWNDTFYQFSGKMEKDEFFKIVENMWF